MRELGRALTAVGFAALTACGTVGGTTYVRAYAEGDRAYTAGRFDEAAKAYAHAAEVAERARDQEEATWASADAFYRSERIDSALALFDRLAARRPPGERTFFAAYRAARIRIDRGQTQRGYAALAAIFHDAPQEGIAHRALRAVVLHIEVTEGKAAALKYESSLQPEYARNQLGEEICYDVATRREQIGDATGALAGFLSCADAYPYPTGALFDDSLWHASLLHEKLGDVRAAIGDLRRLLDVRESSSLNGSYDRPRLPFAQLRIAELQRDRLADHAAARTSFRALHDGFTRSVLRPRALFEEAKLAHDDNDEPRACEVAGELIDEAPDSRWARKADEACAQVQPRTEALRRARAARRQKPETAKKPKSED